MKKLLYTNSLTGVLQLLITSVLTFFTIQIFIKRLGTEIYGVFSLVSVIGNLNIFTNLGLNLGLIKFLSEQGKSKESDYDIFVVIVILIVVLIPANILFIFLSDFVLNNILRIPEHLMEQAKWLYIFLIISNFIVLFGQSFNAVLDSQQKIYITNLLQSVYSIFYWGLILVVLLMGLSLPEIGKMILLTSIVWFLLIFIFYYRIWGKLELSGLKANFVRVTKKQIKYGVKIYLSGLVNFFYEPVTKILISNFLNVSSVSFFDIALKVRTILWSLISKILYPLLPLIAQLTDTGKIRNIVHDIEQKMYFIIIPVIAIILLCSKPFINIWLGTDVEIIALSVSSVVSFYLIGITVMPNYHYLMTKKVTKTIILQFSNAIFNTLIFLLTYKILGYYSVLLSFNAAIMSSFVLSLYYQKKYLNSLIFDSFLQLLKVIVLLGLCILIGLPFLFLLDSDLLKLIVIPFVILISSVMLYRYLNLFKSEDIFKYAGYNSFVSKILLKILIRNI